MKIAIDENNYVVGYLVVGEGSSDMIEVAMPENFTFENYQAFKHQNGELVFDEEKLKKLDGERALNELREQRQLECFPVINRGELWYQSLTSAQITELSEWYNAWLNVTETKVVPTMPTWIK